MEMQLCFAKEQRTDAVGIQRREADENIVAVTVQRQMTGGGGHGFEKCGCLTVLQRGIAHPQLQNTRCTDGQIDNGNRGQLPRSVFPWQKLCFGGSVEHRCQCTIGDVVGSGDDLCAAAGGNRIVPRIVTEHSPTRTIRCVYDRIGTPEWMVFSRKCGYSRSAVGIVIAERFCRANEVDTAIAVNDRLSFGEIKGL